MTDLKKVKYAQAYMTDLANGVDPVSKQTLPNDTCLNNVPLTRCFFFVADVLKQVLENEGQAQPSVHQAQPPDNNAFMVSKELKSCLVVKESLVTITEFIRPLVEYLDKRYIQKIPATAFTEWLVEQGYLVEMTSARNTHPKMPTFTGKNLGITTEQRRSMKDQRLYTAVLYSANAQRFIVEHFEDIVKRWQKAKR